MHAIFTCRLGRKGRARTSMPESGEQFVQSSAIGIGSDAHASCVPFKRDETSKASDHIAECKGAHDWTALESLWLCEGLARFTSMASPRQF